MYTHCIFCHRSLGANETLEFFPVGRRFAFDVSRGRLWVLCSRCKRWNLSPLEERWEAIEECERRFTDASLMGSTDNIAVGRLDDGVILVRVGTPPPLELAIWRYGSHLQRRRRRLTIVGGGAAAAAMFGIAGGVTTVALCGGAAAMGIVGKRAYDLYSAVNVAAFVQLDDGRRVEIRGRNARDAKITLAPRGSGWRLVLPYKEPVGDDISEPFRTGLRTLRFLVGADLLTDGTVDLKGPEAVQTAAVLLPRLNRFTASTRAVKRGLAFVKENRDVSRLFSEAVRSVAWHHYAEDAKGQVRRMAPTVRLGLEMMVHEEAERFAIQEEMALLERAWREAEEIAAIADNLLIPDWINDFVRANRQL